MPNPITNHYGVYIDIPNGGSPLMPWFLSYVGGTLQEEYTGSRCQEAMLMNGRIYASLNALKAGVIRAKCIQRLSVMAYGGGINSENLWEIIYVEQLPQVWQVVPLGSYGSVIKLPVHFSGKLEAAHAAETITPEERAAFLYVYKEGENE